MGEFTYALLLPLLRLGALSLLVSPCTSARTPLFRATSDRLEYYFAAIIRKINGYQ